MGRSSLGFTIDKNTVIFQNETYLFKIPQRDGSIIYKCKIKGCTSTIKLNRNKSKILGGNYTHSHSSLRTPSTQASSRSSLPLKTKPKGSQAKPSDQDKSTNLNETLNQIPAPLQDSSCSKTLIDEANTRDSNICPTSVPAEVNTKVPKTHDAPHNMSEGNVSSLNNIGSSTHCIKSSETGVATGPLQGVNLELQINELKILRDALIDQIMEKEKVIHDQSDTILSMKKEMAKLREELTKRKKKSGIESHDTGLEIKRNQKENSSTPITGKKTSQKQIIDNHVTHKIRNCSLLGDSHCRGLGYYLRRYFDKVETFFKPGAGFIEIKDSSTLSMSELCSDDRIIFFCGTNNIQDRDWSSVFSAVDEVLSKYNTCNLCFVLVPVRWDRPHLNKLVQKFNNRLREKLREKNVTYLDPNYFLRPWHYAKDGLHLNINGKRLMSLKLKTYLEKVSVFYDHPIPEACISVKPITNVNHHDFDVPNIMSDDVPTCSKNLVNNQTPSFTHDQSYSYDLHHLALMNNVMCSTLCTPNITVRPMSIPTIHNGHSSPLDLSCESTFSSPNFHTGRKEMIQI
ncbi:hypothetical protein M8J75_010636 [Diaphorina citri]|nr:hypothetical protein M8J75_010636 [Diaphorina citri]